MQKFQLFLKFWLPVLIWMVLIFSFSSDAHSYEHSSRFFEPFLRWLFPHLAQSQIEIIHHLCRKCCHLGEYAILALLIFRALNRSQNLPPWSWPRVLGALLIVFLYAGTDEFHQVFVPTRTPHFTDVLIDTAGGAVGLLGFWILKERGKTRNR
ncbi:MAG TPA: VanZ family protein [Verrucomicrobiae bacterium]|nr:VanZ family protein [Verrucomicrobiae bacterium]